MPGTSVYPPHEELANRLTHGAGALLSVAGLVLMVVYSALHGTAWHVVSTAIFGATLVLLYAASTAYHSVRGARWRALLQKCDHAAIFLLIAGTYTPFVLGPLRGAWGWSLFGVIWGLAIVGVVMKFWFAGRFDVLSTIIYLVMGWLVLIAAKPLFEALPAGGIWLLVAGGFATHSERFFICGKNCRLITRCGTCGCSPVVCATGLRCSATSCRAQRTNVRCAVGRRRFPR